jgi:hypothetical protein
MYWSEAASDIIYLPLFIWLLISALETSMDSLSLLRFAQLTAYDGNVVIDAGLNNMQPEQ